MLKTNLCRTEKHTDIVTPWSPDGAKKWLQVRIEILAGALTTGTWAVISSLLATVVLHQHLLFRKSKFASFYNTARFVMKYCFSNIKYCYHYSKLSVHFRLKYFIGSGIICLIGSLFATIYYFSMKVQLSQETYPIKKRYFGCCNSSDVQQWVEAPKKKLKLVLQLSTFWSLVFYDFQMEWSAHFLQFKGFGNGKVQAIPLSQYS